ncbi:MAG: hypothetical protein BalsKO_29010 [Balneolaceae bacterium]
MNLKLLHNEYPAPKAELRTIITSLLFGAFIGFFLFFFEPFDINIENGKNTFLSIFFYGLITSTVLIIFIYLFPLLFPVLFSDIYWTVKHQILLSFAILFVIATLNGLYTNFINSLSFSWANYWWIINKTFVLGGIPFSFLILIDYQRKKTSNTNEARYIHTKNLKHRSISLSTIWTITTDLKSEVFTFDDQYFSHAEAVGNYVDIYIIEENKLTCTTYRMSLSSFVKQVDANYLKRCHRSYFVNLNKIENVSGNAQGLRLTLTDGISIVPVSRNYISDIKKFFD